MDKAVPTANVPPGRPAWLGALALGGLILCIGLGMTWQLWRGAERDAMADLQADFDFRSRELVNRLALRVAAHIQILRGVQGLFASSERVTRREFADFVHAQDLDAQFPGVAAIGFMPFLAQDALAAHVKAVQADGLPNYAVRPDGARTHYAPVTYFESFGGPAYGQLGLDLYAEPAVRSMADVARDSAQPALSARIDVDGRPGFMVALPLYDGGVPGVGLEPRRAALRGWIFGQFIGAGVVNELETERSAGLLLALYDGERINPDARLDGGTGATKTGALLRTEQRIGLGGRRWTLVVEATPQFEASLQTTKPRVILACGVAATLILALLTWMMARSSALAGGALRSARALTRELESGQRRLGALADASQRSQAMLRNILDSTIDGILVDNGERRVLASNQRFCDMWGVPSEIDLKGDDQDLVAHLLAQLVHPAPFLHCRALHYEDDAERRDLLRLKDGRFFEQYTRAMWLGQEHARLWSFRDITERKQIEQRERSHRHVLELLARGAPLEAILEAVVLGVEATNPGMLCSILLLDESGRHFHVGAAPSLPAAFNQAVEGLLVVQGNGSCSSAVASGKRVIVENIQTHPDWVHYRALAAEAQLASSWSEPIRGASGRILGSFAIYHRTPHYPSAANVVLIEQAAQLAGIALEQAQAALALRAGEERFRSLYDNAPVALWEQDWSALRGALQRLRGDGVDQLGPWLRERPEEVRRLAQLVRITDVNSAALAHAGAAAKDLGALGLAQNFGADASFIDAMVALDAGALYFACECSFMRLDGSVRQHELTLLVMPGHALTLDFVIVSTVDVTERKRMGAELLQLASTDFLTGLPNRRAFMARLDDQLARMQREVDESAAVLLLDIDHFKSVNDRHGHAMGDAVLCHLAALMGEAQRKIDTLGRVGGEEFAILLPGAGVEAAAAFAERLRLAVEGEPLERDGVRIAITVSIGIAAMAAGDLAADASLNRADKALYRAKAAGRNRVCGQSA